MAKILFGAGVADARNKLGGHVFSRNRMGAYLRLKVSPTQPRSATQLNVRQNFGNLAKAWSQTLTDVQRAGWVSLAASHPIPDQFGNPQIVTGLNYYTRVNRNLFTITQARLDDPPPDQQVETVSGLVLTATVTASVLTLEYDPQTLGANSHLVVVCTGPLSPGRSFFQPFYKLVFADPNPSTGSPLDIFTPWHDIFGNLQETQKIGVKAYTINDSNGAASTPASGSAIITV